MFLNYHRRLNLHMYYCINKAVGQVESPLRKLCISLSKKQKEISFFGNTASVNANNNALTEVEAKKYLGSLFDDLLKDTSQEKRLEIDIESYYSSISLEQYIILRNANEENIPEFLYEVRAIVSYSKESKKILNHIVNDSNPTMRSFAANNDNAPPEALEILAKDKNVSIRDEAIRRLNDAQNETLLRHYIKLIMS